MNFYIFYITILILIFTTIVFLIITRYGDKNLDLENESTPKQDEKKISKALKILETSPKNIKALETLNEYYFKDKNFKEALKYSKKLFKILEEDHLAQVNIYKVYYTYGISLLQNNEFKDALESLKKAYMLDVSSKNLKFYLGLAYYENSHYKEALILLTENYNADQNNMEILNYIGMSLYKLESYKKALAVFNKIIENDKDDFESIGMYARCLIEINQYEHAQKIVDKLKLTPSYSFEGYSISLSLNIKLENVKDAEEDLQNMMQIREDIPREVLLDAYYQIGLLHVQNNNYNKAIHYFENIKAIEPNYINIDDLINKYKVLNENLALRVYITAPIKGFKQLALSLFKALYPKYIIRENKILEANSQYVDMIFLSGQAQWEEITIIRFVRVQQNVIGEFFLKDLASRVKENKARGICIATGGFSEPAKKSIEGRIIDLVDGTKLNAILSKINVSEDMLENK